jgi:hypothetical protein
MIRNFKIHNSIAIQIDSSYFDLHNCYDLEQIRLLVCNESSIEMSFQRTEGHWVPTDSPKRIQIVFQKIKYLEFSPFLLNNFSPNIEEVGFKEANDHDYNWLLTEEQADNDCHIFFRFENEEYLRLYCEQISFLILHSISPAGACL